MSTSAWVPEGSGWLRARVLIPNTRADSLTARIRYLTLDGASAQGTVPDEPGSEATMTVIQEANFAERVAQALEFLDQAEAEFAVGDTR